MARYKKINTHGYNVEKKEEKNWKAVQHIHPFGKQNNTGEITLWFWVGGLFGTQLDVES